MGQGSYHGIGSMGYGSSPTLNRNSQGVGRGRNVQGGGEKLSMIITGVLLLLIVVVVGWIFLYTPKKETQYPIVGEWKSPDLELGTLLAEVMADEIKTQITDRDMRDVANEILDYLSDLVNKATSELSFNFTEAGAIEIMNDGEVVEALSELISLRYECLEEEKIKIVFEWHLADLAGSVAETATSILPIPGIVAEIINSFAGEIPFLSGELEWLGDYRVGADWMLLKIEGRKWELSRE